MKMRRKIKNYLVFTSLVYKIVMFAGIPVALILLQLFGVGVMEYMGAAIVMALLLFAEVLADNWYLGGIQSKYAENMDYLKTSPRGMDMMRGMLRGDLIRKLLTALAVTGIAKVIEYRAAVTTAESTADGILQWLVPALLCYSFSTAATFLARFGCYHWINCLAGYIAAIVAAVLYLLYPSTGIWAWVICPAALLFFSVAVSIVAVRTVMKKVEGGYHD